MLVPDALNVIGIARQWGKTPGQFEALPENDQALMLAHERVTARIDAALARLAEQD